MKAIYLISAHGRQPLKFTPEERVLDVLSRYNIPWTGINLYTRSEGETAISLSSGLEHQISEFDPTDELFILMTRNINPFPFQQLDLEVMNSKGGEASTEFFFRQPHSEKVQSPALTLKKLSPSECLETVAESVHQVLDVNVPDGSKIVLGVSGGGDSNALLRAIGTYKRKQIEVHGVIIKGIPEWDAGVPRAQALCAEYGIELTVLEETETRELLKIADSKAQLVDLYEKHFPGDDFEFLGTLLIRLALMKKAKEVGAKFLGTGINLEDYMAEAWHRVTNGKTPLPAPTRPIGDLDLIYPLWLVPKKIIDGCFPKYSLENYSQRYPCYAFGRSLYYEMALRFGASFPGGLERVAQTFGAWGSHEFEGFSFDKDLGFHVMEPVKLPLKRRILRMVNA